MRQRCYCRSNKNYQNYGARGIKICNEWLNSPKVFHDWVMANGWKKGLLIDRINNDGNYTPLNCRITTHYVNVCNAKKLFSNTSGFTGVLFAPGHARNKPWEARLTINGKRKRIGWFKVPIVAAIKREFYILENNLPHRLNFAGRS